MINIQNITKTVGNKLLFSNISFKIGEGQKVGLVGPNGAGKTTLLRIILQEIEPDTGRVLLAQEKLGYLPQKLQTSAGTTIKNYLNQFLISDWEEYKIGEVLGRVGLGKISQQTPIAKLSGGQKMKVGLAGVLLGEPTTILLDEPTNNLDLTSIRWLEKFVHNFAGKALIISHDRYFLDACVNKIIELNPQQHNIIEYGGNYTSYKEQKESQFGHQMTAYKLQQKQERHMKEWIAEKQQQLQHHPSNKVARQLKAMKTRFQREIEEQRLDKPTNQRSMSLSNIAGQLHKSKTIFLLKNFALYDLLAVPELLVLGHDRISLSGNNGAGKTTLIKCILGLANFYTGEVEIGTQVKLGYFSQEHELLQMENTVIGAFLLQSAVKSEAQARGILGRFLFSKQRIFSQVNTLSEGEKARLLLAIIVHQHNDFLFLDEPTNHLDLDSREVLATALQNYAGGFLVVSHDRYFLEQVGINRNWHIQQQQIIDLAG